MLEAPGLGRIGLVVSLPEPAPPGKLPVVVVLGGLATGERNISHIAQPGENAIIGYDWPIPTRMPQGWEFVSAAPDLYRRAMSVPGQIAAALDWLIAQPWADETRVSVLGFSLGALAAPAAQRLAQERGRTIGWTALAYGGSPLGDLIASNPFLKPRWAAPYLARGADLLFRPLEPAAHLGALHGRFLVIGGRNDAFVPEAAARRMADLTPEPKEVVWLEGGHMGVGPNQLQLLQQIVDITTCWLVASGATSAPR